MPTREENKEFEEFIKTALDAGSTDDQIENFLTRAYTPLNWQWAFHVGARQCDLPTGPTELGVGGARGPGKSHCVLAQCALDDCQRIAGLKGLFLRQTGKAARESFEDLIGKVLLGKIPYKYNRTSNVLQFDNGSRIILGGFENENDIDKYIGIEYDFIAIEELNQLTKEKVEKLKGSMRTSKPNWRPRLYTSFNPGGLGHQWVKENFVIPFRDMQEKKTRFFPSTYKDNPYLNPEYIDYLNELIGDLGKAWREGDWDLFAGQYFSEWRANIHTCNPFPIPSEWKKIVSIDYGFSAPAAVYWIAVDPDGTAFLYRELYITELTFSDLAKRIISMMPDSEEIRYWVADPSIWAKKGDSELSGAEKMESTYKDLKKRSLLLLKGNNDRTNGWGVVREYLKPFEKEGKVTAKLQVFTTCTKFIDTFPTLIFDKVKVEDLDSNGEDHAADSVRYGLMSDPKPAITADQLKEKLFRERMRRNKERNKPKSKFFRMV